MEEEQPSWRQRAHSRLTSESQGPVVVAVTLLLTSLVVGVLLHQVWNQVQIVELGYEMTRLTQEHQRLLERRERLMLETSVQLRTERLDRVARDASLLPISPEQILRVSPVRTAQHP